MFSKKEFMKALRKASMSTEELAIKIGIGVATLYRKMSGESDFYREEIYKICKVLRIDNPMPIFFAE